MGKGTTEIKNFWKGGTMEEVRKWWADSKDKEPSKGVEILVSPLGSLKLEIPAISEEGNLKGGEGWERSLGTTQMHLKWWATPGV